MLGPVWLRFQSKLFLASLLVMVMPLIAGGVYVFVSIPGLLEGRAKQSLKQELFAKRSAVEKYLAGGESDLRFLANLPQLSNLIQIHDGEDPSAMAGARQEVEALFLAFAQEKPLYTQVRFLDSLGKEVVRVDRKGEYVRPIPGGELQDKSDRYYFTQAKTLPLGAVYVSPLDLNKEWGEVEQPLRPVLRLAAPVAATRGAVKGMVVLNVLGAPLLEALARQVDPTKATMLIDSHGFYMLHPNPAKPWGGPRDLATGENLFRDFPGAAGSLSKEAGVPPGEVQWLREGDSLLGLTTILPSGASPLEPWVLVSLQPWEAVFTEAKTFRLAFSVAFAAALLMVSGLQVLAILGVTGPLVQVLEGVRRIGEGQLAHRLRVGTGDELQELAEEFNEMAERLESAQAHLEHEVKAATRQLQERNAQLQALYETGIALAAELSLDRVLQKVVDLSRTLTHAQYGALGILGPEGVIDPLFVAGLDQAQRERIGALPRGMGILGVLLREGGPIRVPDLTQDPRATRVPPHHPVMHSFLGVPITSKGRVLGDLYLGNKLDAPEFTDEDETAVLMLAAQASIAIENAQLHAMEQATVAKLQELDELKSDFVSMVTHELRTPIAAIRGFVKVLQEHKDKIGEQQREAMVGLIEQEAAHLAQLIEDVLSVTRIEAGRLDYLFRPTTLKALLEEVGREAASRATSHQIAVHVGKGVKGVMANADPDLLKQVLANLVDNAMKFSPAGGPVTLGLEVEEGTKEAYITVADEGLGIAPEDMPKLFKKFSRIQDASTRGIAGTGLGLYITSKILEAHGGRIWVESSLGQGSKFTFTLPVCSEAV